MVFVHGSLPAAKTRRHVEVERHGILADERGGVGGGGDAEGSIAECSTDSIGMSGSQSDQDVEIPLLVTDQQGEEEKPARSADCRVR